MINRVYGQIYKNIMFPFFETIVKKRNMLKCRSFLEKSQWWPYEKLQAFQWGEMVKLLNHTYETAPFWHEQFDKLGLKPSDIKSYDDLRRIPIISKKDIRENYEQMRAVNYNGKTWKKSTGGSTGEPLHFEYTPDSYDWRVAVSKRGYSWAGCEDGLKQAYIWGAAIGKERLLKKVKENIHHSFLRQKYFNCFKFDEKEMAKTLAILNRYKPVIIVGYTNPLYDFSKFISDTKDIRFKPTAIISAAEKLYEFQREKISAVFECPVFNTYGSREFMLIASECEAHKGLHVNIENIVVEIIKENGEPAKPGEMGDVVITDLHNYGMPFIRYRIGDMAIASDRTCSCGRGLPMVEDIIGRSLDVIRTPDGRAIPGEFFPHLMKEFEWVKQFQVIQEDIDSLIIKIVKTGSLNEGEYKIMRYEIYKVMGKNIKIELRLVDDIPLTATGKHRVAINNIK